MMIDQLTQQIDQKRKVRREIDLQKEIALILDAVKKFGPRNISLIARQTGIPRETVRVRLLNLLPRYGFVVRMLPNYYKLGLTRYFGYLRFPRQFADKAKELLRLLGKKSYLMYWGKVLMRNEFVVIVTPPYRFEKEYLDLFEELADAGVLDDYWFRKVRAYGHPHASYRYFDFGNGKWSDQPVNDGEDEFDEVLVNEINEAERAQYIVDSLDLKILQQLQYDALKDITEIAGELGVHPRVVSYHFNEHVVRKGLVAGWMVSYVPTQTVEKGAGKFWMLSKPLNLHELRQLIRDLARPPASCQSYNVLDNGSVAMHFVPTSDMSAVAQKLGNMGNLEGELMVLSEAKMYLITIELFHGNTWLMSNNDVTTMLKQLATV
jgi:DNA-binding Lrp family transcriptional regulator